ncbi:type II toxin-antitoxin system prevent-host-death family antitoxin [Streptomyces mirabilis]|uniref:type II toxin-antitoxin system prevent-host-death family antitoxin n=1 Tax=Streptomyces mirabilis TaxID=68239 RepID=UPI0036A19725
MSQSPQAEHAMNASDARRDLYALVKRAEDDGVTTLIHRMGSKREDRVLLAPLDRFPAARKADAFPSWALSAAQKDFGTLVSQAASGQPQVLRRNNTPVAVLLPADPHTSTPSSDPAAPSGAAPAGGAVNSQGQQDRESAPRRLATLGDAIGSVLTTGPAGGPTFGLPGLDAATGGLQPGRLTIVAARPDVGGSLLGLAAARTTALVDHRTVLYAASGPNRDDVFRRILSAETGGDYPRLKQGRLTAREQEVARQLVQAGDVLLIDDGSNLTAEDIAETAPHMEGLALVVVDRLQATHSARLPLSGNRLPDASQILSGLARTLHVPVLAVVDSDDPTLLSLLDADVLLTLTATTDPDKVQVTVAERDFGVIGSAYLRPDLLHARFLDAGAVPVAGTGGEDWRLHTTPEEQELADAALPYTSGAQKGLPSALTHLLAALRTALAGGDQEALGELGPSLAEVAAAPLQLPDSDEGRRLAAALNAYTTDVPAGAPGQPAAVRSAADSGHVPDDEDDAEAEVELQPGDEEDEPESAPFPALKLLKDAVDRSRMHPVRVIRLEDRENGPWPLISEDMAGEPKWVHPDVTSTRVAHIRDNGKRVRRDKFDVPDTFGDGVMCLIDRNGSFPSACSAVPLAPNKLVHTGPLNAFDKGQAGIYLIDIPEWNFPGMPHPLGQLIDRADDQGRVWVTTPHIKQLERLHREGHLTKRVAIHDSWTGRANESLFKPFYTAAREARTGLVQVGGDSYAHYKTRVSIALRLLWPKRQEQRSPFWRPDWRMSMVAEASVRHWTVAFKAVQEGHTLIALRKVDAAIFWTPDETPPDTYRIGTGFGEVKAKFIQPGEFIPEGDD